MYGLVFASFAPISSLEGGSASREGAEGWFPTGRVNKRGLSLPCPLSQSP